MTQITPADLNFAVTSAKLIYAWTQPGSSGFTVKWETASAGFGETGFYTKDGKLFCDNEAMGKFFIANVLMRLVEEAELTS